MRSRHWVAAWIKPQTGSSSLRTACWQTQLLPLIISVKLPKEALWIATRCELSEGKRAISRVPVCRDQLRCPQNLLFMGTLCPFLGLNPPGRQTELSPHLVSSIRKEAKLNPPPPPYAFMASEHRNSFTLSRGIFASSQERPGISEHRLYSIRTESSCSTPVCRQLYRVSV
jgi:hypothetical protein